VNRIFKQKLHALAHVLYVLILIAFLLLQYFHILLQKLEAFDWVSGCLQRSWI